MDNILNKDIPPKVFHPDYAYGSVTRCIDCSAWEAQARKAIWPLIPKGTKVMIAHNYSPWHPKHVIAWLYPPEKLDASSCQEYKEIVL